MALYKLEGCSFSGATLIAANDDNVSPGTGLWSKVGPKCLEGGETYYILIDGYNTGVNTNWGILIEKSTNAVRSFPIAYLYDPLWHQQSNLDSSFCE